MKNTIQKPKLTVRAPFDLQSAIRCSGNRKSQMADQRYGVLRPGFWVFVCLFWAFMVSDVMAQVTHLQVLDADGRSIALLELFQRQSTKYVLEKEVKELFSGTGIYESVMGRVTLTIMGKKIVFRLRQNQVKVDGEEYVLSAPPVSISGNIAVPVEFLTVIMPAVIDKQITLDQNNGILQISGESFAKDSEPRTDSHVPVGSDAEFRVIIDPGHGGRDTGSRTKIGQLEKDQTLKIAQQIKAMLAAEEGIDVYLTRSSDRYLTTTERVNSANTLRGHVYLSIHFNWSPFQRSRGFGMYVNNNRTRLGPGLNLGADMLSSGGRDSVNSSPEIKLFLFRARWLAKELAKQLESIGLSGEQNKEAFLADMDDLSMPGVLVEVLYFSNRQDQIILSRPDFINSVSRAFCDSILGLRDVLRN